MCTHSVGHTSKTTATAYTAGQHPQTQETECVYHGTRCLVACDGEIVCRTFGHVVGRAEEARGADVESHVQSTICAVPELLGTADPKIGGKVLKVYTRGDGDIIWRRRIRHIADHFGVARSIREEIEFVFVTLRRKTSHRPSQILFFAFYNTCRHRGACMVNEEELRSVICHCCNLRSMHSVLKIYGIIGPEAQKIGLYDGHGVPGFYFNTYLNTSAKILKLDGADRDILSRKARQRYAALPESMSEKKRTKNTFQVVLGKDTFEAVRGRIVH